MKKTLQNPDKELRLFATGLAIMLLALALAQYLWGGKLYFYFIPAGLLVLLTGLIFPVWMKPLQWLMIRIGNVLNWFITNLILAFLFYLVFTLIGLIWRLIGHRPLDIRYPDKRTSYWRKRTDGEIPSQRFEKQY